MKVPCKITLSGDKDYARNFIGAAQSQMRILEDQLTFRDLKQGVRRRPLDPRTTVEASICFDLKEVKIYSEHLVIEMKEEEGLEKLIPRFFAYVVKVDGITGYITKYYMWIYFVAAGTDMSGYEQTQHLSPIHLNDDYDVYVWGTQNSILETMKNTPRGDHTYPHPHRHTKSFMMDDRSQEIIDAAIVSGEDLKTDRYVSACHMLTKNRQIIFMPLHAYQDPAGYGHGIPESDEICDILDPDKYPSYPLPYPGTYFLAYADNILFTGLNFPCPPRRFYCNPEDGLMVWYSTNSTVVEAQNYICGIIYDVRNNAFRTFWHQPSEVNGLGFTEYWAVDIVEAELPTPLMFDVQALDSDGIDVAMAWSKRPVNCHTNFSDSSITYSELGTCNHIRWIGTSSGFEAELFTTFSQCKDDVDSEYEEDIIDLSGEIPPCFWDGSSCNRDAFEYYAKKTWDFHGTFNWYSTQAWDLLGNALSVQANRRRLETIQYNREAINKCLGTGTCYEYDYTYSKDRYIRDHLLQQATETYSGRWVCPNALDLINNKHKKYCDGEAQVKMIDAFDGGTVPGFMPTETQMNDTMCEWTDTDGALWNPQSYFSYPCFNHYHNDTMPDDWIQIDVDTMNYNLVFGSYYALWDRTTTLDTSDADTLHSYQIDNDLTFLYDDVDHIYYLDDRATDDNQGVVAAGKGDSATVLYTDDCLGLDEYKPDYWKIMWKVCWDDEDTGIICADIADEDIPYIDITDKLLEALDCEDHELLDLGLI